MNKISKYEDEFEAKLSATGFGFNVSNVIKFKNINRFHEQNRHLRA